MGLPNVLQRLEDLENRVTLLDEYSIAQMIREADLVTEFIKSLDRIFNLEMNASGGAASIIAAYFESMTPEGYYTHDNALIAPVSIVYEGNPVPYGAALVLNLERITV